MNIGGLGDVTKVLPEVMAMSRATQEHLYAIREILERLLEVQERQSAPEATK